MSASLSDAADAARREIEAQIVDEFRRSSRILDMLSTPLAHERKGHTRRKRFLFFTWLAWEWDETEAEYAARVAALPKSYVVPVRGPGASLTIHDEAVD